MYNIELYKLKTLKDAPYPQEGKYPSGSIIKEGLMWDFSKPTVGQAFMVLRGKLSPIFRTSLVSEILEDTANNIKFKTTNSIYNIIIVKTIIEYKLPKQ